MSDATTEVKTLDYYLQHPTEMPTDPQVLEKLFEQQQAGAGGEGGDDPSKDGKAAGDTPAGDEPAGKTGDDAGKPADEKIDGVQTKDGKHIIPYSEMERRLNEVKDSAEAEAAARKEAEDYAKQLEAQLAQAKERIEAVAKGEAPKGDQPLSAELPKEMMETLESEFPTIAQAIKAQQAALTRAIDVMKSMEERVGQAEQFRANDEAAEVQDLIAKVPDLGKWQKEAPYLFARAQEVESALLADKKFMEANPGMLKDDVGRYKEVVNRVRAEIGLPPVTESPSQGSEKSEQQKADEIVAGATPATPRSLSDMPAGKAPASTATDSLENLSAAEIGNRFLTMTPEQIQAQLARL